MLSTVSQYQRKRKQPKGPVTRLSLVQTAIQRTSPLGADPFSPPGSTVATGKGCRGSSQRRPHLGRCLAPHCRVAVGVLTNSLETNPGQRHLFGALGR